MEETKEDNKTYNEIYKAFSLIQRKAFCVAIEKLGKKNIGIDLSRIFINFILPSEAGIRISVSFYIEEIRSTASYFISHEAIDSISVESVDNVELALSSKRYEKEMESYQRIQSAIEDDDLLWK